MKVLALSPCFLLISFLSMLSSKLALGADLPNWESTSESRVISSQCFELGLVFESSVESLEREKFCFKFNYKFSNESQVNSFCDVAPSKDEHPTEEELFYVKKESELSGTLYYNNICLNENYESKTNSVFPTSFDNLSELRLEVSYDGEDFRESITITQEQQYFVGNQVFMSGLKFLSGFQKMHLQDEPNGLPRLIFREGESSFKDNEASEGDAKDQYAFFILDISNPSLSYFLHDNQTFSSTTTDNASFFRLKSQTLDLDNVTAKPDEDEWLTYLSSKLEAESDQQCYFVLPHGGTALGSQYECIRCNLKSDNNTVASDNKAYLIKATSFTMDNKTLTNGNNDNITVVKQDFTLRRNNGLKNFTGLNNNRYYVAFALFSNDNSSNKQMIRYSQDNDTTSNQSVGTNSDNSTFMCRLFKPERNYTLLEVLNGRNQNDTGLGDPRCFIATAAYGSSLAKEVDIFRWFRNKFLLTHALGRSFVEFYYEYSPPLAKIISEQPTLAWLVRMLLWPLALFLQILKWLGLWQSLALSSLGVLSFFVLVYKRRILN